MEVKGTVTEHKKRIERMMIQQGGPPPIVGKTGPTAREVMLVIQSLHAMLSRLMTKKTTPAIIEDADRHVKIFLTYYSRMDAKLPLPNGVPAYISRYNFISLLRLPNIMKMYGPLRNFWEGSVEGEAMHQAVKREMNGGIRPFWQISLLTKLTRLKAFETVDANPEYTSAEKANCQVLRGYHRYGSLADVQFSYSMNRPMSGVLFENGDFGLCMKGAMKSGDWIFPVRRGECVETVNSLPYHKWKLSYRGDGGEYALLNVENIKENVLFLPRLSSSGYSTTDATLGRYAVITDEWHQLSSNGNFELSTVEAWDNDEQ